MRRTLTRALCLLSGLSLMVACAEDQDRDLQPAPSEERGWVLAGSLNHARDAHTATLVGPGHVLVAGGYDGAVMDSAELYFPASGAWRPAASLDTARSHHTTTPLWTNQALVVGGYGEPDHFLSSAELYDHREGAWSPAGNLATGRHSHTSTLLRNGMVLVVGGEGAPGEEAEGARGEITVDVEDGEAGNEQPRYLAGAELYHPRARVWTPAPPLQMARSMHTATRLRDGSVLIVGGKNADGVVSTAELFDPDIESWTEVGSLSEGRHDHSATLLPDGRVLVAGGIGESGYLTSAELYDPSSRTWIKTGSLNVPRGLHEAVLLPDGRVLLPGGERAARARATSPPLDEARESAASDSTAAQQREYPTSAEIYDPERGSWSIVPFMYAARARYSLTLLPSGDVLVAGGYDGIDVIGGAELFVLR